MSVKSGWGWQAMLIPTKKVGWMKNAPFYKYELQNQPATTYLACCHNLCARCGWGAAGFKLQRQGSICRSNKGA
jgi:hypothetical protein